MTASEMILIISPFDIWGLNTLSLHNAVEKDYYYDIIGKTEAENINDTKSKLNHLIDLCSKCEPQNIYKKYGKDKFRKIEDFYIKSEPKIRGYIKQLSDKNISEAIRLADEMDIKIFYRQKNKEELLKKAVLKLSASEIIPKMSFKKTDNGIDYNLKLYDGTSAITPSMHTTRLLADNPGVLTIDNTIYMLPDDFSGKIISPFINKENTFIPKHMQNEYFRKFILKNVYKSEISAEGFDIIEEHPTISCGLNLHADLFGKCKINVSFEYGKHVIFNSDSTKDRHVRLEEDSNNGFRFVKIIRDFNFENGILDYLTADLNMPTDFRPKYELIEWLNENAGKLKDKGIVFTQEAGHEYVIGKTSINQTVNRENDWFQLFIEIVLEDGTTLKFSDIKEYLQKGEREVPLKDGRYFVIPEEWFARYTGTAIFGRVKGDRIYLHRSQQNIINGSSIKTGNGFSTPLSQVSLPSRLHAQLRKYQKDGFEWLYHNLEMQTGCCLSDDMGLGKTIQTIALILKYKETCVKESSCIPTDAPNLLFSNNEMQGNANMADETGKTGHDTIPYRTNIVVSPASVVHNWKNELRKFAPSLNVLEYIGSQDERKKKREALMTWDVVLTTYQTMRNDIEKLSKYKYGIIVFDEAQCFKNRNSQIYKSVLMLNGIQREALSGTPMENSLNDLWSLMNVLNPMLLGDFAAFSKNYIAPITSNLQSEKTSILRKLISPYFLKRTKEEVLPELPSRQDETIVCEMQEEQKHIYNEELSKARNMLISYKSAILDGEAKDTDDGCTSIHVLTAITRLRQIANHPLLANGKIDNKNQNTAGHNLCESSGKMTEIFSRLENLHGTCHKVLLFSESVAFLKIIAEEMTSRQWTFEMLTGETSDRESAIRKFTETPSCQYFLISLKAGGVGLNLTTADYVFLLDPWWNKSAEEQAISRSHRIGQHNSVFVYRFISKNTLEEQIMNLQDRKQTLIESVMPFIAEPNK